MAQVLALHLARVQTIEGMMAQRVIHKYKAVCVHVRDGDTIVCDVDLGFSNWIRKMPLRLLGVDCPERGTEEGKAAAHFTVKEVFNKEIIVVTSKQPNGDDARTFDRYVASVYYYKGNEQRLLNEELVLAGHAKLSSEK